MPPVGDGQLGCAVELLSGDEVVGVVIVLVVFTSGFGVSRQGHAGQLATLHVADACHSASTGQLLGHPR